MVAGMQKGDKTMGGCFVFYATKQTERSKAEAEFQRLADASRYESGHSYSGEIGMKYDLIDGPSNFQTVEDARTWVEEHNDKWGPAHLVRLTDGRYCFGGWCSS